MKLNTGMSNISQKVFDLLNMQYYAHIVLKLCVLFCLSAAIARAEDGIIVLDDGTLIQLGDAAVIRKGSPPGDALLWSVAAHKPQLPLLFTNSEGEKSLFYFTPLSEHYGEYHALRVADGRKQWMQPVWSHTSGDLPVSPVFFNSAIYLGHGLWLEQMNLENGQIVERYPARTQIQSLRILSADQLEIQAYEPVAREFTLTFEGGSLHPQIAAPGNLLLSLALSRRARWVLEDFDSGYLELYRLRRQDDPPLAAERVLKYRDFDLPQAEEAYRRAYQADPTNPYFALYLALTLYYQQRYAEAETYKNEALAKAAPFWEESLRAGGFLCEPYQLTHWADEFYAQGMARYIQVLPAPPEWGMLIEILIHFGGTRSSAFGPFERALHVLQLRRQIMPYTEGDNYFSREYVRILKNKGQHEQAAAEARRIGKVTFLISDFLHPTPFSFIGILIASVLVGGLLILHNEIRHRAEWWPVLLAMGLIGLIIGHAMIPDHWRVLILLLLLTGYSGAMSLIRKPFEPLPGSQWRFMLDFVLSSYIVLLTAMHIAYLSGQLLTHSPVGGKAAEAILIGVWFSLYRWLPRHAARLRRLRHVKIVLALWVLIWCHLAWMHHYLVGAELATPLPSIDYGHPNWQVYMDGYANSALFLPQNLRLMQAACHHLGADEDAAVQMYQQMGTDARAINNLGVMRLQEDAQQAQAYFEQALALRPNFAPALYNLGVLTRDSELIEQARSGDPLRVETYQTYAPGKPWIVTPTLREWTRGVYWSQGGFPLRGFTEISISVRDTFFSFK